MGILQVAHQRLIGIRKPAGLAEQEGDDLGGLRDRGMRHGGRGRISGSHVTPHACCVVSRPAVRNTRAGRRLGSAEQMATGGNPLRLLCVYRRVSQQGVKRKSLELTVPGIGFEGGAEMP